MRGPCVTTRRWAFSIARPSSVGRPAMRGGTWSSSWRSRRCRRPRGGVAMSGATALGSSELPMIDLPGARCRGLGELRIASEETRTLPLAAVSLRARVADRIAEVEVEQRFQNPCAEALEAIYIF